MSSYELAFHWRAYPWPTNPLLFDANVLVPLFRALGFASALRRVCVVWRDVYDVSMRPDERPLSRWVATELDLARMREAQADRRCRFRVVDFIPRNLANVYALEHAARDNVRMDRLHLCPPPQPSDTAIGDLSRLGGLHVLAIFYNRCVEDVSALGRIRELHLIGCPRLVDVSPLSHVHTLYLNECANLKNVSALGRVHTLSLASCRGVTDVSALGRVHELNLSDTGVRDVSALGRVHTLDLSYTGVSDVSALGRVHTLVLSGCHGVTDVSALGRVHTLFLFYCTGVSDVSALRGVKVLRR